MARPAREAGEAAFEGAKDAAKDWWATEGQAAAEKIARKAADAARQAAVRIAEAKQAELEEKVNAGTATPMEVALWVILAGLGAGGSRTILQRLFGHKPSGT